MIDIAIVHAGWDERRKPGLARLVKQLLPKLPVIFTSASPEDSTTWARRAWEWVAQQSHPVAILNDDIDVCPDFRDRVEAMIEAVPDQILSLHAQAADVARLASEGHRWARAYQLTGPAYVLHPHHARALLDFWAEWPELQHAKNVNEDNVASQWAFCNQRPMWLAIPAVVQHDVSVPSTLGYDHHLYRQSSVPWTESGADLLDWSHESEPPWIENPWFKVDDMARRKRAREALRSAQREGLCMWCAERAPLAGSPMTGVVLCASCLGNVAQTVIGRMQP